MTGSHSGVQVNYGSRRLATAMVAVDGTGGAHSGGLVALGSGKYALAVVEAAQGSGGQSDATIALGGGRYTAAGCVVDIGSGVHSGALIDFRDGRRARAVVFVDGTGGAHSGGVVALGVGRYALAVTPFDIEGSEIVVGETMAPSELGAALAYHFEGDSGVTSATMARIPGNAGGVNGVLSCVSNATLHVANQTYTYAGFFSSDSFTADARCLMSKCTLAVLEWIASIDQTTGVLRLTHLFTAAPTFRAITSANAITAGTPFHAAWGTDGSSMWVRLNGGTRATVAHVQATNPCVATSAPLRVGTYGTNDDILTGSAGNIGYWRGKSLSDAELDSLYNSGAGVDYSALAGLGLTTNLVSYWRMTERDGTRFDSVGTNHFANTNRCQAIGAPGIVSKAAADGDTVSQWADQSANNRHLTPITAPTQHDYRPLYNATGLNNLPTIRFLGNQTLRRAFTLAQPAHIFVLVKPHNWGAGAFLLDGNTENAMGLKGVTSAPTFGLNAGSTGPSASIPIKQWSIVEASFNGASSFIRVNGGAKVTGDAGSAGTAGLWFGVDGGNDLAGDYPKHSDVEIAEVFTANAVQSDADSTKLRRYLTQKYAGGTDGSGWPAWEPDKLVVVDGHSQSAGHLSGVSRAWWNTAQTTLGGTWDFLNLSYNDKTMATARSEFAARSTWAYNASRSKSIYCPIIEVGSLSDASGLTAQQAWDAYKLHLAELRAVGWKVIAATPTPFLVSVAGAGYEARRQSYRTIALADTGAYDAIVDIGANANIGGAGEPPADSLYFDTDRVHLSYRGSAELGGLYATAIASV